jgi:hypothetical protein
MWQGGGISINKEKVNTETTNINTAHFLQGKYNKLTSKNIPFAKNTLRMTLQELI